MKTPRRTFLKISAMAGAAGLLSWVPTARANQNPRPMRILILGGTGSTGPLQVRYALKRGHKITVFNRGRTHPGELPKEVEQLLGDRNGLARPTIDLAASNVGLQSARRGPE